MHTCSRGACALGRERLQLRRPAMHSPGPGSSCLRGKCLLVRHVCVIVDRTQRLAEVRVTPIAGESVTANTRVVSTEQLAAKHACGTRALPWASILEHNPKRIARLLQPLSNRRLPAAVGVVVNISEGLFKVVVVLVGMLEPLRTLRHDRVLPL